MVLRLLRFWTCHEPGDGVERRLASKKPASDLHNVPAGDARQGLQVWAEVMVRMQLMVGGLHS